MLHYQTDIKSQVSALGHQSQVGRMDVEQFPGTRDGELKARRPNWARFGVGVEITGTKSTERTQEQYSGLLVPSPVLSPPHQAAYLPIYSLEPSVTLLLPPWPPMIAYLSEKF